MNLWQLQRKPRKELVLNARQHSLRFLERSIEVGQKFVLELATTNIKDGHGQQEKSHGHGKVNQSAKRPCITGYKSTEENRKSVNVAGRQRQRNSSGQINRGNTKEIYRIGFAFAQNVIGNSITRAVLPSGHLLLENLVGT